MLYKSLINAVTQTIEAFTVHSLHDTLHHGRIMFDRDVQKKKRATLTIVQQLTHKFIYTYAPNKTLIVLV